MAAIRKKVLILLAHPSLRRSEVSGQMARIAEWVPGVTLVDLYAEYPAFDIDPDREQQRLRDHDVVIFLHPFYWYSTPALLKEWQDIVLEHGFAYGEGGTALRGKIFLCAISTAGRAEAYGPGGYNNFTLRQLLAPLEQTARLCQMTWLAPFALHGARSARDEGRLKPHLELWEDLLEALVEDRVDIAAAQAAERLGPEMLLETAGG